MIVEFRKESLSFSDDLNILTMKLSYSTAWFAHFMSSAPFLGKHERAPASRIHKLVLLVGEMGRSKRRIIQKNFTLLL